MRVHKNVVDCLVIVILGVEPRMTEPPTKLRKCSCLLSLMISVLSIFYQRNEVSYPISLPVFASTAENGW
jgi:hypothetical protein